VLGYHAYTASATWLIDGPSNQTRYNRGTPDFDLGYVYDRWRPTLFAALSSKTSFFAGPPTDSGAPSNATLRQQEADLGVQIPFDHVRVANRALAEIVRATGRYAFTNGDASLNRTALRAGWATATPHTYGYSISPEKGVLLGATGEWTRAALGSAADASAYTVDVRAYLPALGRHQVLAIRGAAGSSSGDPLMRRTFLLGGATSAPDVLDFGSEAFSLLRGFPADSFAGSHAAVVNADYRVPLLRPERGVGTFPLFLHTVHASLFADAGHAWTGTFRREDVKTSAGAELSIDLVAGYFLPLTATVGVGWGHDGATRMPTTRTIYLRVGRAF
jgi:outer membrane protein assembly factor BamA